LAVKFLLRAIPECENHLLFRGTVDLSRLNILYKIDRGRDTRLEFGNVRLGIWKYGRVHAGQQSACDYRMPIGLSHLPCKIVHVGIEPRIEQDRWIYLPRLGMPAARSRRFERLPRNWVKMPTDELDIEMVTAVLSALHAVLN